MDKILQTLLSQECRTLPSHILTILLPELHFQVWSLLCIWSLALCIQPIVSQQQTIIHLDVLELTSTPRTYTIALFLLPLSMFTIFSIDPDIYSLSPSSTSYLFTSHYMIWMLNVEWFVPPQPIRDKIQCCKCQGHELKLCHGEMFHPMHNTLQYKPSCLENCKPFC